MTTQEMLSQLKDDVATQDSEIIQQPPKVVICTGISGCDRLGYLKTVQQIAEQEGKELKIFDVGSMMFQRASDLGIRISDEKILDLSPLALQFLRGIVYEEAIREVGNNEHTIIATRTCFRWDKYLTPAFDVYYLDKLAPDMYVTIIDSYDTIKQRLDQVAQWRGRLSLREILIWRDEETFITELLASYKKRPHYVIARDEPPETLFHLIFTPGAKKAYVSYPITKEEQSENIEKAQRFIDELRNYLIVFNPLAIKDLMHAKQQLERASEQNAQSESARELNDDIFGILEDQTVARDYKFIDQSDMIIVYYFREELSAGVMSEMIYGFTNNKEVYVIFPYPRRSPFLNFYSTKVFNLAEELFNYFKERNIITSEGLRIPIAMKLPFEEA